MPSFFSASISRAEIHRADVLALLLKDDVGLLGEVFIFAAELHFDFHVRHIDDFLNKLVRACTSFSFGIFRFGRFLPAERSKR